MPSTEWEYETSEPLLPAVPDEPYPSRYWPDEDEVADLDEECLRKSVTAFADHFTGAIKQLERDLRALENFDWERG